MKRGVLSAIGNTPLVHLDRALGEVNFNLYGKLEALNPAGSSKDRPAFEMIAQAWESGEIGPDTVVIESSSGNMGIGLAQICGYLGLRFICVVDVRAAEQNLRILKAYGVEVDIVTEPDRATGEYLQARLQRVRSLQAAFDNTFWPNQYASRHNAGAHYRTTMHEIATRLEGRVDYLLCATSTCGTIRGCCEYVRDHGLETRIVAVDAVGSVIFGGRKGPRLLPGLGAGLTPELCDPSLIDECVYVTDVDCITGCRWLIEREAILAGASSGAVIHAMSQIKDRVPPGANCVVILPDRGERYLDTVYSDEWVSEHFGDVSHLWARARETAGEDVKVWTGNTIS